MVSLATFTCQEGVKMTDVAKSLNNCFPVSVFLSRLFVYVCVCGEETAARSPS